MDFACGAGRRAWEGGGDTEHARLASVPLEKNNLRGCCTFLRIAAPAHDWLAAMANAGSMKSMRTKSMFGAQALSTRPSAANFGFGTSTRAQQARVFAGGLAAAKSVDPSIPGPRYNLPNPVGTQYTFGTQARFGVPGRRSAAAAHSPGPGAYDNTSSVGRQIYSTNTSFPRYGFGTADRAIASRVFISPQHAECGSFGRSSPGPASINNCYGGMGSASHKFGFGTDGARGD